MKRYVKEITRRYFVPYIINSVSLVKILIRIEGKMIDVMKNKKEIITENIQAILKIRLIDARSFFPYY
jgi:hypothetical protein